MSNIQLYVIFFIATVFYPVLNTIGCPVYIDGNVSNDMENVFCMAELPLFLTVGISQIGYIV